MPDSDQQAQVDELRQIRLLITEIRDMEREQVEIYRQSVDKSFALQRNAMLFERIAVGGLAAFMLWFFGRSMGWW